jgi:succinate dehydrogenase/fumarate reductase-like Fe-S protein
MGLREVTFKVFRFDSQKDILPCYKTYILKPTGKETILDILDSISKIDDTLGYSEESLIKVDGEVVFAKSTKTAKFIKKSEVVLEPADSKYVKLDFLIGYSDLITRYNSISPIKEAKSVEDLDGFEKLAPAHFECPIVSLSDEFAGPLALNKAFKLYQSEVTHTAQIERLKSLNDAGLWDCLKCGKCDNGLIAKKVAFLRSEAVSFDLDCAGVKEAKSIKNQITKTGQISSFCTILGTKGFKVICDIREFSLLAKNSRLKVGPAKEIKAVDEIKKLVKAL